MLNFLKKETKLGDTIGSWLTIKRLIKIYIIFIVTLILSIVVLNNLNKKYVEGLLISNTETQLNLMNDSLKDNLFSAQMALIKTMRGEKFSKFLNINSENQYTSLEENGEIEDQLEEIMNYINLFGSLDVYTPEDNNLITTSFEEGSETDELTKFYNTIKVPGWYQIPKKGLYYIELYPIRSDRESKPIDYLVAGKIKKDFFSSFISSFNTDPNVKVFFEFLQSDIDADSVRPKLEKSLAKNIRTHSLQRNIIQRGEYSYKNEKYTTLAVYNPRSEGVLTAYFNQEVVNNYYKPVSKYFTLILIFLLMTAIFISILFYLKVYRNIRTLTTYFKQIEKGNLSARITNTHTSSEFGYVFSNFNNMMNQIESLMVTTKKEVKLRERAELRQLQSQINPHFLYNSLFFITSMATTSPEAVISMTENLAEYYRYTTKNFEEVTIEQELGFVENYLKIMSLRKKIKYSITVSPRIMKEIIPPLIIQPLVENALYHGVEERKGASEINISGRVIDNGYLISVSDDGKGMTSFEIDQLQEKLKLINRSNTESVGLWNLNHRLINLYGNESELHFFINHPGLTVSFWIPFKKKEEE